ncbi:myeloid leukemia factor isoform X2 [Achroia grisella]|uniref:myeloid leukemia factor isoform X2 n=1 Tax=Achroia grisella TaxID=688607 RepID=UPI0027D1F267|nr:myeloid leukemia factor isoform X2 [Achroia grisella]
MSLFGSLMGDFEDDPFFGHMRQMNSMMNSMFSDPFGMLGGGGPLALTAAPRHACTSMMPMMPQMPMLNRLFTDMDGSMGTGSSFSSSTVIMSSGPNGKPQVYSTSSSTKIGPNGLKETRKTLQDSRTGTKKMSIGHHIGERAHVIEREQNFYSGDAEERQEFINLDEEEAEDFDREFQTKAGMMRAREAIAPGSRMESPRLALPAPPPSTSRDVSSPRHHSRPSSRRPIRNSAGSHLLPSSTSVREVYGGSHPQRHRHKHQKTHRHSNADN